ncbi:MAG: hypothetical protein ACOX2K_07765 [Bacillota bacterium]|jgi:hypothetical protein
MQHNRGNAVLGWFLVLGGGLGLAINLGYFQFRVEMVAAIPFLLGSFLLYDAFSGHQDNLFPALLFVFISAPLYLTLAGYANQRFWPFWVLAPGLAFLMSSLQGGAWRPMAIPGTIITAVGLFFLAQEWWNVDWHLALSIGLLMVGALLLVVHRRREP